MNGEHSDVNWRRKCNSSTDMERVDHGTSFHSHGSFIN